MFVLRNRMRFVLPLTMIAAIGFSSEGASATRTRISVADCFVGESREIRLGAPALIDQLAVLVEPGEGQSMPEITISSGGFSRKLRVPGPGEHVLRFYPGLRGGTFRLAVEPGSPRPACVQQVFLSSGTQVVATIRP